MRGWQPGRMITYILGAVIAVLWLAAGCSAGGDPFTQDPGGGLTSAGGATGTGGGTPSGGSGNNTTTDDDNDGFSEIQGDCNDDNPNIHPDAEEICDDEIDNNCNGAIDLYEPDGDNDGYGPCQGDCDDGDPNVNPAATEVEDGIDNNCDEIVDDDYDGDGYTSVAGDCEDQDPTIYPGAKEDCYDGVDNDCNTYTDHEEPDTDSDGFGPCEGDCAEGDPNIGPHMDEIPGDGIDNNCDNLVDQDIDGDGWTVLNGDCNDGDDTINPAALELCDDNIDNNCDGITDTDCLGPCDLAATLRSSVGCTYYGVDMENLGAYNALQYAIAVSNVSTTATANVSVQTYQGSSWQNIQTAQVGPLSLHQFNLPDNYVAGTTLAQRHAYRVISDYPVIAYQFNPVDGQSSHTSDASLLLPTSSLDKHYQLVGYPDTQYGQAQLVIIASKDGTSIDITSSIVTSAGGPLPALQPGQLHTVSTLLNEGDYLQISSAIQGDTFNGTIVETNHEVAVLSGHTCVNLPPSSVACDHLEEQIYGLQTWGTSFVAARLPVRSWTHVEPTIWHIYASENNTQINLAAAAAVIGLPTSPQTLNAGQWLELTVEGSFAEPGDFMVTADKPIHVMAYMTGCSLTDDTSGDQGGDPAMTQMVPIDQFRDDYVVLVPLNWIYDYFILTKRVGETISVDGNLVPQSEFTAIDDGINPVEWEVARVAVADGVHTLTGSQPFGVVVLGYDYADSYAYPGGLNQAIINPIN